MRILKIIHGYPPNYNAGSEVYSQSICEKLSEDNEVFVFTREENPYAADFSIRRAQVKNNLMLFLVNMAQGKDGYRHQQLDVQFAALIDEIKPEVAHIGHLNHLSTGIVDVLKERNIPIVFTLHDFWLMCPRGQFLQRNFGNCETGQLCDKQEDRKCAVNCYSAYFSSTDREEDIAHWTAWIQRRMQETRSIIDKADLLIAPSRYLMERFTNEFSVPGNRMKYLDYGFPTHYLTPTAKAKHKTEFTFGYIGTHITSKGVNLLIEAFKLLNGNARLLIWGSKDQQSTKALKQLAQDSRLNIEFRGEYINRNLADEVFSETDCIVVPSTWAENSPLVIHEAQACRIPVITADFGGMKEYVHHNVNGLLFEHRNFRSLAVQMQWALDHQKEFQQLGERGYLNSEDGKVPDIADHCDELQSIYASLIAPKNKLWRITIDTNPEDCNLSCVMCEEHSVFSTYIEDMHRETGIRKRRMPVEWLDKIFTQATQLGVKEIIPSTMGEPLLYKGIERIYELARENDIQINLTTNGTFPRKSVQEWAEIIVPQTSDVKISWNGANKETAEQVMPGLDFDKAIGNVKEFVAFRDDYFRKTGKYCRVTFQLTFMQNNMHELGDIIKLAAELNVDRVKGHHLWDHFEEIRSLSMKRDQHAVLLWNTYVEEARQSAAKHLRPGGQQVLLENIYPLTFEERREIPDDHRCPFLEKELWISATGKISPCCAPDKLRNELGDFGNIRENSIGEVMSSSAYRELVSNYGKKELCKTCNMRKP